MKYENGTVGPEEESRREDSVGGVVAKRDLPFLFSSFLSHTCTYTCTHANVAESATFLLTHPATSVDDALAYPRYPCHSFCSNATECSCKNRVTKNHRTNTLIYVCNAILERRMKLQFLCITLLTF